MTSLNQKMQSEKLHKAFDFMNKKKLAEAEALLAEGLKEAEVLHDELMQGMFCSAYGIFYKIKKDFRKAWKYYEKAEKFIPEDPTLKIISANLLCDFFGQYDIVIRKMNEVLTMVGPDFTLVHQAYTLMGRTALKKGDKVLAIECFKKSMGDNFNGLVSPVNFNFKLLEMLSKRKIEPDLCRDFLNKGISFSKAHKNKPYEKLLLKMLELFNKTNS
ncbi:hypothetical protein K1X76_00965 [bacterium]|nr:hypothetical protein [bacterium]